MTRFVEGFQRNFVRNVLRSGLWNESRDVDAKIAHNFMSLLWLLCMFMLNSGSRSENVLKTLRVRVSRKSCHRTQSLGAEIRRRFNSRAIDTFTWRCRLADQAQSKTLVNERNFGIETSGDFLLDFRCSSTNVFGPLNHNGWPDIVPNSSLLLLNRKSFFFVQLPSLLLSHFSLSTLMCELRKRFWSTSRWTLSLSSRCVLALKCGKLLVIISVRLLTNSSTFYLQTGASWYEGTEPVWRYRKCWSSFHVIYRTNRRSVARNRINGNSINGNLGKQTQKRLVIRLTLSSHMWASFEPLSPAIRHHHDAP